MPLSEDIKITRPQLRWSIGGKNPRVSADPGHHVHLIKPVPVGIGDFRKWLRLENAGVVNENVDSAREFERVLGQADDLLTAAHVGDDVPAATAGVFEDLVEGDAQFVFVAAGNDNVGPRFGHAAGHRLAETFTAARNQSRFAGQVEQVANHVQSPMTARRELA